MFTYGCLPNQKSENDGLETVKKKKYEPNVDKRIAESSGITLFKGDRESSFAKQNVMWKATLQTLDNFPITVASYEGGIIATDWYSSSNQNESIKIQVNFLSTSVASSSFEVLIYKKECSKISQKENCNISLIKNDGLAKNIKDKIVENIRLENIKELKK